MLAGSGMGIDHAKNALTILNNQPCPLYIDSLDDNGDTPLLHLLRFPENRDSDHIFSLARLLLDAGARADFVPVKEKTAISALFENRSLSNRARLDFMAYLVDCEARKDTNRPINHSKLVSVTPAWVLAKTLYEREIETTAFLIKHGMRHRLHDEVDFESAGIIWSSASAKILDVAFCNEGITAKYFCLRRRSMNWDGFTDDEDIMTSVGESEFFSDDSEPYNDSEEAYIGDQISEGGEDSSERETHCLGKSHFDDEESDNEKSNGSDQISGDQYDPKEEPSCYSVECDFYKKPPDIKVTATYNLWLRGEEGSENAESGNLPYIDNNGVLQLWRRASFSG